MNIPALPPLLFEICNCSAVTAPAEILAAVIAFALILAASIAFAAIKLAVKVFTDNEFAKKLPVAFTENTFSELNARVVPSAV